MNFGANLWPTSNFTPILSAYFPFEEINESVRFPRNRIFPKNNCYVINSLSARRICFKTASYIIGRPMMLQFQYFMSITGISCVYQRHVWNPVLFEFCFVNVYRDSFTCAGTTSVKAFFSRKSFNHVMIYDETSFLFF